MKKLLILFIVLCAVSCKKYVVSFEQPTNMKLDNLKLEVFLDKEKVKEINLKATEELPTYETVGLSVSGEGKHLLQVKTKDTTFSFDVKYPEEKFIRIITNLKTNGKIHVGILKQNYKYKS
ncbi:MULTISPECIES: hypothetical protein [Flavobacterium]|uniref:Uncharacterized protein n=1 Tax=Flavobacterium anhuiense TaxID=459526 RepID=A0AAC9D5H0_9FLAO|nr:MULTISPECIES: hypothetical protein [Flavobacterium]AOC95807.1 hypothetical protein BB050_02712 [Flavobacterium anhuiense]EJF99687.1 hypothetical protein FF52_19500 [Flavobacterium sp. F52]SCY67149.1 hypothetical protein SAMN02927916_2880 [Flavobacterium anhuiense]